MGKIIDITGQRFGKLQVIRFDPDKKINNKAYWICQCDCGNIVSVHGQDLRQGKTKSCGCYMKKCSSENTTPDMTGQKFHKLTVLKRVGSRNNRSLWECQCECGKNILVTRDCLLSGNVKSCGCLNSYAESLIEDILIKKHINYIKQFSFPDLLGDFNSKLRFDFAIIDDNNKILYLIEFQGEQHYIPRQDDTIEVFQRRLKYDTLKQEYCQKHDIPLIQIPYTKRQELSWKLLQSYFNQYNKHTPDIGFDWAD